LSQELLSACEASIRCSACSSSDIALLRCFIALQEVYARLRFFVANCGRSAINGGHRSYAGKYAEAEKDDGGDMNKDFDVEHERLKGERHGLERGHREGRHPGQEHEDAGTEQVRKQIMRAIVVVLRFETMQMSGEPVAASETPGLDYLDAGLRGSMAVLLRNLRALLGLDGLKSSWVREEQKGLQVDCGKLAP
jgi:hypothetical protein